jgi:hypothetical protein
MIRRFAAVIWWLGALAGSIALYGALTQVHAHSGCSHVIAKGGEVDRKAEAARADYRRQHPNASAWDLAGQPLTGPTLSDEESAKLSVCKLAADFTPSAFLVVLTAALWAAAFVLGGRFWLPPIRAS